MREGDKEVSFLVCDSKSTPAPKVSPVKPAGEQAIIAVDVGVSRHQMLKMVVDYEILHQEATLVRAVDCAVTAENRLTNLVEQVCGLLMENLFKKERKALQSGVFKAYKAKEKKVGTYADLVRRDQNANISSEEKAAIKRILELSETAFLNELTMLKPKTAVEESQLSAVDFLTLREQTLAFAKATKAKPRTQRHKVSHMSMFEGAALQTQTTALREEMVEADGLASVHMNACRELVLIGLLMLEHPNVKSCKVVKDGPNFDEAQSVKETQSMEDETHNVNEDAKACRPSKCKFNLTVVDNNYKPSSPLTLVGPCRSMGLSNPEKGSVLAATTRDTDTLWTKTFVLPSPTSRYKCCLVKKVKGGLIEYGRQFEACGNQTCRFLTWTEPQPITVVIIGEHGTGKTALLKRMSTGKFDERYEATLHDEDATMLEFTTNFTDTISFSCHTCVDFLGEAQAAIIMCETTARASYATMSSWISMVSRHDIPVVICVNKSDLKDGGMVTEKIRKFNLPVFEICVKDGHQIELPFLLFAKQLIGYSELHMCVKLQEHDGDKGSG